MCTTCNISFYLSLSRESTFDNTTKPRSLTLSRPLFSSPRRLFSLRCAARTCLTDRPASFADRRVLVADATPSCTFTNRVAPVARARARAAAPTERDASTSRTRRDLSISSSRERSRAIARRNPSKFAPTGRGASAGRSIAIPRSVLASSLFFCFFFFFLFLLILSGRSHRIQNEPATFHGFALFAERKIREQRSLSSSSPSSLEGKRTRARAPV